MSFTNEEWFVIENLNDFVNATRALVYNNFGQWNKSKEDTAIDDMVVNPSEMDELDKLLTQQESTIIIKQHLRKQKNKLSSNIRYLVCDSLFLEIIKNLNDRIVSNTINSLVQKGLLESAYDDDLDDFIFWVKEDELPKTD